MQLAEMAIGEITKDEYDDWRYNYPRIEAERTRERLDDLRAEEELVMIWDI